MPSIRTISPFRTTPNGVSACSVACHAGRAKPAPPLNNQFDPNNCLSQTTDNRPQWDDVGLHDILFAIGQPTVPAPNYVRLPYDYAPPSHWGIPRHYRALLSCGESVPPRHEPKGSLYLWHFLRL